MMKKCFASVLAGAMLFSSIAASASSFTDLNQSHAWAESQIEEMTAIGIIKGYTDGSFRPDQAITKTECLVLVSRAAGYMAAGYDEYKTRILEVYSNAVSPYNTPYPGEVSFLLYKGILTEDDLPKYISPDRADSPVLRYEMAELLTKLMGSPADINNKTYNLTYSDLGEIPFSALPYVDYVTKTSLMQGGYDLSRPNETFFNPYNKITRAQMAVLLHRILSNHSVAVRQYSVLGKVSDNNAVSYRDDEGKTNIFAVKNDMTLTIDGYPSSTVEPVNAGARLAFFTVNGVVTSVEVLNDASSRWDGSHAVTPSVPTDPVEGVISTIILSDDCRIVVNGAEYALSSAAMVYVNQVACTVYDLRVGSAVRLEFAAGKVIMVYASSPVDSNVKTVSAEGDITKINLTNRYVYMDVVNSQTGEVSEKLIIIETGASIVNGISGKAVDFLSLEVDNHIIATGTFKADGNFYASKIIIR